MSEKILLSGKFFYTFAAQLIIFSVKNVDFILSNTVNYKTSCDDKDKKKSKNTNCGR